MNAMVITDERFLEMMKLQMAMTIDEARIRFQGRRVKFPGTKNVALFKVEDIAVNNTYGLIFKLSGQGWFSPEQVVFIQEVPAA